MAQTLLEELRESKTDFAAIRTELDFLSENVKSISKILREGNGDLSVLTKLALLNQKIDDINKWKDAHDEKAENLEKKLLLIDKDVTEHKQKQLLEEKTVIDSLQKEAELAHEQKLSKTKLGEERQKAILKIAVAVTIAVLTFLAGWFTKTE